MLKAVKNMQKENETTFRSNKLFSEKDKNMISFSLFFYLFCIAYGACIENDVSQRISIRKNTKKYQQLYHRLF